MDTDGEAGKAGGSLIFNSSSRELADGVAFLVESFGGTARRTVRHEPRYRYRGEVRTGRLSYRVILALPAGINPFRAFADRYRPRVKYQPSRIITAIKPAGVDEVICIAVDAADSLYVVEHCIVTHNTIQALGVINADPSIKKVLVVCPAGWRLRCRRCKLREKGNTARARMHRNG